MAEDAGVLSELTPQPAPNPDFQTTVNDFLDYTEFFPSDLVRSLRLISDLDSTYQDATQTVHELTAKYGKLPTIPANERPDPVALRREIAATLDKAISCRESTFAEASRLYEVAQRHCRRIEIIKKKLQALPQPPSRDPTPVPVSPQALKRGYDRPPHLRLTFDGGRHGAARPRDRKTSNVFYPGRIRSASSSDLSDSDIEVKTPKPLKSRARPPGSGTNVHSSIAGISTSNALARLSPPPPNAKPGSKWAPWFKLTEYEMAVLRKQMKKNAVWTPSETMIKRQLDMKSRGQTYYDKEKARCEATGEEFLDEEPVVPSSKTVAPPPAKVESMSLVQAVTAPPKANALTLATAPSIAAAPPPAAASPPAVASPPAAAPPTPTPVETIPESIESPEDIERDSTDVGNSKDPKKTERTRESHRRRAMQDVHELEAVSKTLTQAADGLKELSFATPNTRKSATRSSNKRKREASPHPAAESPSAATRETSLASQDSGTKPPDPKRKRTLQLALPETASDPQFSVAPSLVANTQLPETTKTTTVPLAAPGPSTPKTATRAHSKVTSRHNTPIISPTQPSLTDPLKSPTALAPNMTAASTRSRRESVAPKTVSPPAATVPTKVQKAMTPAPDGALPNPTLPTRPRSARGHVPTPKAQSEEPKPYEQEKAARELRRHSIFSQSAIAAPTRMSTRKKPPPKGDITAGEDGQKTVTNVKRAQGNKNKKKKKADDDSEPMEEIDPNEERYCICDDVSYGQMISCDNNCDKEWFHLECVGMTSKDIPARRAKWYCPDCRAQLGTDAYGNPPVPPPLPGRRGNRGWST